MRQRYYVGINYAPGYPNSPAREVFRAAAIPAPQDYPQYGAVIGPFETKRGAEYMAQTTECRSVAHAEILAKKEN